MVNLKDFISAIIITDRNSECLNRAISSVSEVVDEIVLIHTGNFKSCLKNYSSRIDVNIYTFTWINDFSAARNFGIEKAKGEICFMLDSDEYLTINSQPDFRRTVFDLFSKDKDALYSPLINNLNGYLLRNNPRLFRKKEGVQYKGYVHEYLSSVEGKNIQVPSLIIEHTGYCDDLILKQKKDRNKKLLDRQLTEDPGNARWHFFLLRYLEVNDPRRTEVMNLFYSKSIPYSDDAEVYCLNVVCRHMIEKLDTGLYDEVLKKSFALIVHYPCIEIGMINAIAYYLTHKEYPKMYSSISQRFKDTEKMVSDNLITELINPSAIAMIKSEFSKLAKK